MHENKFGELIRQLREQQNILQRQLAAYMDMDTAMLSKIENGSRKAKREQIPLFAKFLNANEKELSTLWLADQIYSLVKDEENAGEALKVAEQEVIYKTTKK